MPYTTVPRNVPVPRPSRLVRQARRMGRATGQAEPTTLVGIPNGIPVILRNPLPIAGRANWKQSSRTSARRPAADLMWTFLFTVWLALGIQAANGQGLKTPVFDSARCVSENGVRIAINPLPGGGADQEWTWDNQRRTRMLPVGCAAVDGNVWSLNSADGGVKMSLHGALETQVKLTNIVNRPFIVGYPEVLYGYKPFQSVNTIQATPLLFPMSVSTLPALWMVSRYSITVPNQDLPVDFSYDLWITEAFRPNKVQKGDIELMIWLFHQNLKPAGKLLSKHSFTGAVWINGEAKTVPFDVYVTDPTIKGHTSTLISFAMRNHEQEAAKTGGWSAAYIAVDLRAILRHMMSVMNSEYGWSLSTMQEQYVNGIELGSEFGRDGNAAALNWRLDSYCLVLPVLRDRKQSSLNWKGLSCPSQGNATRLFQPAGDRSEETR